MCHIDVALSDGIDRDFTSALCHSSDVCFVAKMWADDLAINLEVFVATDT